MIEISNKISGIYHFDAAVLPLQKSTIESYLTLFNCLELLSDYSY